MKIGDLEIFPSKIICLGRNYLEHIEEMNAQIPKEPVLFLKALNCLITSEMPIIYPKLLFESPVFNRVDHEVELAVIIKGKCKNISKDEVYEHILGYTIFLDLTARNMQNNDRSLNLPWFRSKSFDTFGPIGPRIALCNEIKDPHDLKIELKVNKQIKQSSNTKYLLFKIPELIEYISQFFTLESGDIIATGTPSGVGPIIPGDILEATIQNIGTLKNNVILEDD
jgi:2-keto-4-pentenoate hydratase/2-oxohepta-3-ene-1,7-dioic acid hydratase in catechol pathway